MHSVSKPPRDGAVGRHSKPRETFVTNQSHSTKSIASNLLPPTDASSQAPIFKSHDESHDSDTNLEARKGLNDANNNPVNVILQSFLPRVAVYASSDTEDLVRLKGVSGGLCGLLKPFGENLHGKVTIRDSFGASRSWGNYGVHFVAIDKKTKISPLVSHTSSHTERTCQKTEHEAEGGAKRHSLTEISRDDISAVDEVIGMLIDEAVEKPGFGRRAESSGEVDPPYLSHFLRKMLSDRPIALHEPFSLPVACVIAISSQCSAPIETLRDLYMDSRENGNDLPSWVEREFLRYYVLVHDEDHDDIATSVVLFDQMKRHFGLHCHLLRIRSTESTGQGYDSTRMPLTQWLSAEEELLEIQHQRGMHRHFY